MKVVIAIDSFKGSMSSIEAGEAAAAGIRKVYSEAKTKVYPLADGGEGTVRALAQGLGGSLENVTVTGPLGAPVVCEYAIWEKRNIGGSGRIDFVGKEMMAVSENASVVENTSIIESKRGYKNEKKCGKTAIIEMAGAAGITLVPPELLNPINTTTYGVGEVIKDAISKGCRNFIIGIGGSATNDGGIGMLQALGGELLDKSGKQVPFGAEGVEKLASISCKNLLPELKECSFRIACDVDTPLYGEKGCSYIFGPQKGATPEMVELMDGWMENYAKITEEYFADSKTQLGKFNYDPNYPGCGAAGGLGFAFRTFLHGKLEPGISIVLEEIGIENQIKNADIVITGEGRLDGQTVMGKAPIGIARLAKKYVKPVLAFSGSVTEDAASCNEAGIDAFFPILRQVTTLEEAMDPQTAQKNMESAVEQVFRVIRLKERNW